jgi:uncharacterized protein YuzE
MKVRYFADIDTLWIELRSAPAAETRDLDEDALIEIDEDGNVCAITLEHASERNDVSQISLERVPA